MKNERSGLIDSDFFDSNHLFLLRLSTEEEEKLINLMAELLIETVLYEGENENG